jgi:hypothetical protein
MLFNVEKCKVMHTGFGNGRARYMIDGVQIQEVHEEMDLGVLVQDNLKCAQQCTKVVGKAHKVLGIIRRTFKNFSSNVVMKLYKCLIRPRLEYCSEIRYLFSALFVTAELQLQPSCCCWLFVLLLPGKIHRTRRQY